MKEALKDLIDRHLPSPSHLDTVASRERILDRLQSTPAHFQNARIAKAEPSVLRWRSTFLIPAAAALVLAAVVGGAILWTGGGRVSYRVVDGTVQDVDAIQTDAAGATLALTDGSRVEMRSHSALSLARASDGLAIRLRAGDIIVNAAKQRTGHLYVHTKDMTVSVVGTVFFVSAANDGSRVGVIEGEVRVREGTTETRLRPGEQVSTSSTPAPPLRDEITWSRHAEMHLALLDSFMERISQAPAPRDTAANRPERVERAMGIVRGRITAGSGDPIYRVRVVMTSGAAPIAAATADRTLPTAVTGDDGRFEIRNVPAGTYAVTATRSGYLSIQYGQQRPRELGQPVTVRDGEVVENIDMVLFKGAVLAGRVVNEQNEPSVGVRIEAMDLRYTRGRRALASAAFGTTDDLGEFRISGLEPGTYYVRAANAESWGDEDPARSGYAYALTYYPGVVGSDRAQPISLATGQEAANLDFSLVVGRAARISGRVEDANGEPAAGQFVALTRVTPGAIGAFLHGPVQTDRTGAFEILNIPPGEYWLRSGAQASAYSSTPVFVVEDADVSGLVVTFNRPGNLSGTIVTDDATATLPSGIRIVPVQTDEVSRPPSIADTLGSGNSAQPAAANGSFRFMNIRGTYLFRTEGLPAEWMLKAVRLNDRDIMDTPFEIPQGRDTTGLQLVVTRSGATVAGTVINANGAAEPRSTVIVFSADDKQWGYGTRFVKAGRPDKMGAFTLTGLPTGSYFAVAREFVADGQWNDPDFLRSLVGTASRVELSEKQTSTVKLTVVPETTR